MFRVVVTDDRFAGDYAPELGVLEACDAELVAGYELGTENLRAVCADADAILVNQMVLDADFISGLRRCRVISRYGTGYEKVDVRAATEKGIWVARVPDYCYDEVAEHALALLLAVTRRVSLLDRQVRSGGWNIHSSLSIPRLSGRSLGILGYGGTGRSFHRKASGLGFSRVLICDHHADHHNVAVGEAEIVDFQTLLAQSDIISIHIPMRQENYHLIDADAFSKMKTGAVLINTARGALVDQEALLAALREEKLSAAGLDVFEEEPPIGDARLSSYPQLVLTDHCAYYSEESIVELKQKCAENALLVLQGKAPASFVVDLSQTFRPDNF
ncbi:C-terminal binding protein [Sediminispirochaeta smaragdinae]|jgi:D-3-phosphoglycerate dehydrogenase|uniref:D-isomer specific 2-hydroxyacid dehydrogenase NAD-binding protein n=1 Tax=Sediminispirochaeta smaragdinae (strain DSM 11293 / JCM 15392 / SEBR 4228) TaxID=573413 RepID=E1R7W9_SEDSS|nr:C-terminal binding protein [Sediminispirochaeta smaragdinae]ADK82824.1 D-isomer specific 2-hydroxyacid dehydrogenase NAD-binding protein [Sediminispirochaeta smaragdinae DSM 11293]